MKKILLLQPYLSPYRIDTYNYLSERFELIVLFWFKHAPEQKFNLAVLKKRARFSFKYMRMSVHVKNRVLSPDIFIRLFNFRPDVVICHEFGFFTLITLLLKPIFGYKVIISTDDNTHLATNKPKIRLKKNCCRRADGVITISPEVQHVYDDLFETSGRSIDMPILYDEEEFSRNKEIYISKAIEYIYTYRLNNKKTILYVGRFNKVKCLDILVHAVSSLNPRPFLILVGSGEEEENLKQLIADLNMQGSTILPGRFDGSDLYAWYFTAGIFVLPSKFEPFGAVVNEALLSGLPVLCSNVAGASTLINESNGVVFAPEDTGVLGEMLHSFLPKLKPTDPMAIQNKISLMPVSFRTKASNLVDFIRKLASSK